MRKCIWSTEDGWLITPTSEQKAEVSKIKQLWAKSEEYNHPAEQESVLYSYAHPDYEIGTVTERTGVAGIWLFEKQN